MIKKIFKNFLLTTALVSKTLWAQVSDQSSSVLKRIPVPDNTSSTLSGNLGAGFGTYNKKSGDSREFGGLLFSVHFINDNSWSFLSPFYGFHFLVDGESNQMIRKSVAFGGFFYIAGGKQRVFKRTKVGDLAASNPMGLALVLRGSQDFYTVTPEKAGLEELRGTVFDISAGFNVGWNYGITKAIGLEILATLIGISSSIERDTASAAEVKLFYRQAI